MKTENCFICITLTSATSTFFLQLYMLKSSFPRINMKMIACYNWDEASGGTDGKTEVLCLKPGLEVWSATSSLVDDFLKILSSICTRTKQVSFWLSQSTNLSRTCLKQKFTKTQNITAV